MPKPNRNNSGQVLVVTSLVVVLLLISTVVYVTETQKNAPVYHENANIDFSTFKQAASHTVVSALANISSGGSTNELTDNLNRLKAIAIDNAYNSMMAIDLSVVNAAPYSDGVWISWGSAGVGVSSAAVNCALNASGISSNYYAEFTVNETSSITISGFNTVKDSDRQVTVTCKVFNEDKPAQAENFTIYYQQKSPTAWIQAPSPITINYGNGTYQTTFTVTTQSTENAIPVSIHCQDTRGISIWANTTCTQA